MPQKMHDQAGQARAQAACWPTWINAEQDESQAEPEPFHVLLQEGSTDNVAAYV